MPGWHKAPTAITSGMPKIGSIIFPYDLPSQVPLKISFLAKETPYLRSALKPDTSVHAQSTDGDNGFLAQPEYGSKHGPAHDKRDMFRLGRKQELKRFSIQ